jgi:hypothetical protein
LVAVVQAVHRTLALIFFRGLVDGVLAGRVGYLPGLFVQPREQRSMLLDGAIITQPVNQAAVATAIIAGHSDSFLFGAYPGCPA